MISFEAWLELIPEFAEIRDPELRALSLGAIQAAAEKGGWTRETVALAPVTVRYRPRIPYASLFPSAQGS